jgi:hypothetical protein
LYIVIVLQEPLDLGGESVSFLYIDRARRYAVCNVPCPAEHVGVPALLLPQPAFRLHRTLQHLLDARSELLIQGSRSCELFGQG